MNNAPIIDGLASRLMAMARQKFRLGFLALGLLCGQVWAQEKAIPVPPLNSGLVYTNYRVSNVPWSIFVVRAERTNSAFAWHSLHAENRALGLDTISGQLASMNSDLGTPLAAINGDFYQRRDRNFMGDPRGLQISEGELLSDPSERASFWIDTNGQPQIAPVSSKLHAVLPGANLPFGLNEPRSPSVAVLFTPSAGASTHTAGGREYILERSGDSPWLPLQAGVTYSAKVKAVREAGNSPLTEDTMVLSLGARLARTAPALAVGTEIRLMTATTPDLAGVATAISGGPILVQNGKKVRDFDADQDSFEFSSMLERHPRTALGWNSRYFFFVEVDGRSSMSDGMTLEELASFMTKLGCENAMNLDGGGSSTLWYNGRVRNRPCDGHEREIANSLVLVRKKDTVAKVAPPGAASP